MSQIVVAENFPDANIAERSSLTADAAAAQAVIKAENVNGLAINDYLLVGKKGQETAELMQILSISGQDITLSGNLTFKHYKDEPIFKLRGNAIKFYRAANVDGTIPAIGNFSTIATIAIEPDQLTTSYLDNTGGSAYWYLYTFFNQTSSAETDINDAAVGRGGDVDHYCTIEDVRREAGFMEDVYIADTTIADHRDNAESEVKGALSIAGYTLPLTTVPPVIRNVTKLLAAGYLLLTDYGVGAEGSTKEGNVKIKLAQRIIDKIQKREIVLVGIPENVTLPKSGDINGWPLDETKDADEASAGGAPMFTVSHEF